MEQNPGNNSSDSELSDGWTVLNGYPEQDSESCNTDGNSVEASDEDSVEMVGVEKLEEPKPGEEESDGISVISESDTHDNVEIIPEPSAGTLGRERHDSKPRSSNSDSLPVSPAGRRKSRRGRNRTKSVLSESDVCDNMENMLVSRNGKRGKYNRTSVIIDNDACSNVPVLHAVRTRRRRNDACMRIYVHRPNEYLNSLLTVLVALALAAVVGLGTGHFLGLPHALAGHKGTKKVLPNPQEMLHQLEHENELLRNELQELLKERRQWKAMWEAKSNQTLKIANIHNLKLLKNINKSQCIGQDHFLNHSIDNKLHFFDNLICTSSNIHSSVNRTMQKNSLNKHSIINAVFIPNTSHVKQPLNNKVGPQEFLNVDSFSLVKNKIVVSHEVSVVTEPQNSLQSTLVLKNIQGKKESAMELKNNEKTRRTEKLADEVKLALESGLELATKLKEALSDLHSAFKDWKKMGIDETSAQMFKIDGLGERAFKQMKHVFNDGGKAQKLLSKTVHNLETMKQKLPRTCEFSNFYSNGKRHNFLENDPVLKSDSVVLRNYLHPSDNVFKASKFTIDKTVNTLSVEKSQFSAGDTKIVPTETVDIPVLKNLNTITVTENDNMQSQETISHGKEVPGKKSKKVPNKQTYHMTKEQVMTKSHEYETSENSESAKEHKNLSGEKRKQWEIKQKSHNQDISFDNFESAKKHKNPSEEKRKQNLYIQDISSVNFESAKKHTNPSEEKRKQNSYIQDISSVNFESAMKHKNPSEEKRKQKEIEQKSHKQKTSFKNPESAKKHENPSEEKRKQNEIEQKPHKQKTSFKNPESAKKHENPSEEKRKQKENKQKSHHQETSWIENASHKFEKNKHKFSSHERDFKHKNSESCFIEKSKFKHQDFKKQHNQKRDLKKNTHADNEYYKHLKYTKTKYYHKFQKPSEFRYENNLKQRAWLMNENGFKVSNVSGDWFTKLNNARAKQREDGHRSDWFFERAASRKLKRYEDVEKARWYFMRARSREYCRTQPHSDWCKSHEKYYKYERDERDDWNKKHHFDNDDFEHSSHFYRDSKSKHFSKFWKGTKFISQAFKAALKLVKS